MRRIDQYDIGQIVGIGAFAQVFRARCRISGECVALKLIDKVNLREKGLVSRVQNEIRIHWKLKHVNILKMNDFFEDESYVYFSLELCDYGDLYHYLKLNGAVNDVYAKIIGYQTIMAVKYLHLSGIVHRDIKLSNLLLCHLPSIPIDVICHCKAITVVKLCDFGLATRLSSPTDETYTYCGTPYYLAPEVGDVNGHGFPSDIWSFGCLLKLLLSPQLTSVTDSLLSQDPAMRPTASQVSELDYFCHTCARPLNRLLHDYNFDLFRLPPISHTSRDYQISIQKDNGVVLFLVVLLHNSTGVVGGYVSSSSQGYVSILGQNSLQSMKLDKLSNSLIKRDDDDVFESVPARQEQDLTLLRIMFKLYNKLLMRIPSSIIYLHKSNDLIVLKLCVMSNKPIPVISGRFDDGSRLLYDTSSVSIRFTSPNHPEYLYKQAKTVNMAGSGLSSFSCHPNHVHEYLTRLLDAYDILLRKKSLAMSTDSFPEVYHHYSEVPSSPLSQSSSIFRQNRLELSDDGSFVSFTTSDGSLVRLEPNSRLVWYKSSPSLTNSIAIEEWEKYDIGLNQDVSRMPKNLKSSLRSALQFLKST